LPSYEGESKFRKKKKKKKEEKVQVIGKSLGTLRWARGGEKESLEGGVHRGREK